MIWTCHKCLSKNPSYYGDCHYCKLERDFESEETIGGPMTRLSRYLEIKYPGDIRAISSKISSLRDVSSSSIQIIYSAFCDDVFSTKWVPVTIDDYPLDQFKAWLEEEILTTRFVNAPSPEL